MSARDEGPRRRLGRLLPPKPQAEVEDELAFHFEQRVRDYEARGMSPEEARQAAAERLGDVRDVRRECTALLTAERRTTARRDRLRLSWLDFKLGFRMLVKYPGLTIVGGLAMAFAICFGAVAYQLVGQFLYPTLTLAEGDRVVRLANWDARTGSEDGRALHDFVAWRETLRTVTEIGAFRDVGRTLVTPDGASQALGIAEMTASGFRVARVAPLLGRTLVAADEHPGAPTVIVLGHDLWQRRFAGDPRVVGQTVRLGETPATVVGVMPEGFAFPIAHEAWMPLRLNPLDHARREGPAIDVFGRLAPGASLEEAQAELTAIGQRAAAESPETHEHLRPRVAPYTTIFGMGAGGDNIVMFSINLFVALLLVLVCGNVALLVFARAASREAELVVRSALGASRGRIVGQLFAEALALGAVAAVVGISAAYVALDRWGALYLEANDVQIPFWFDVTLSPAAVLYAAGLTVFGSAIAGVLPALKVTRGLAARLRTGTSGGGGLRFGGVWTAVIVAQVAITVAFPAVGYVMQRELIRIKTFDVGFADEEYLAVRLDVEVPAAADVDPDAAWAAQQPRFAATLEEVRQWVAAEPGIAGVTFVDRLPRDYHRERYVETDAAAADSQVTHEVSLASIDPSYFEVLKAPIVAGRAFRAVDLAPDARVAIVDQGFVERVLDGRNPIGVRVRYAERRTPDGEVEQEERPWFEIVGVVPDLGMAHAARSRRPAGLYFPAVPGSEPTVHMMVHARGGDPLALTPRIHELVAATDPTLRLSNVQRMDQVADSLVWVLGTWLRGTAVLSAIALLLSLAGIYAVLSFTVARRTREIGVRIALGANRRSVLAATFRRPLTQVALGVVVGGALIAGAPMLLAQGDSGELGGGLSPRQLALLAAYAAFMLGVCMLACIVPTQHALRIEPTEALRAEG